MTQEEINKLRTIILRHVLDSVPDVVPSLYKRGFRDGVHAALNVLVNADLFLEDTDESPIV